MTPTRSAGWCDDCNLPTAECIHEDMRPDPAPLNPAPTVPTFPVDALPDWWAAYVTGLATATQTPVDMVASVTLGVVSTCITGRVAVQPGPQWTEPTNLYTVTAMEPGNRKSSVFSAATRPLRTVEKELIESARPVIEQQEALKTLREDQAHALRKQAIKGDPQAESEYLKASTEAHDLEVHALPRLLADDATPEAIATLAAGQGGRLTIAAAEGGIFDIFAGRYTGGVKNLDVLLRGHAGDSYRVDRKGREPEHIESLTLTFILTVQPSVLRQIGETPVEKSRGELERFMYAVPSSFVGYRKINPAPVPQMVANTYESKVSTLARRYADRDATATLTFDPEATDRFTHVQQRVEASLRRDGMLGSPRLKGWGSKLAGAVARLAGILHIASGESDTTPITAESVEAAAKIGDYYAAHAVAAFDLMDRAAPNAKAEELLLFIRRNGLTEFSARDILTQTSRSRFADADIVGNALDVLTDHGWIFPQEVERAPGPGRPPSPRFTVHPRAFQNDDTSAQSAQPAETPTPDHSADTADIAATSAVSNLIPAGLRADRSNRAKRSDDTNSSNTLNGSNRVPEAELLPLSEDPPCDVCGKPIRARHVAAHREAIHPGCKTRQTA